MSFNGADQLLIALALVLFKYTLPVIMKNKIEEENGERRVWGFHGKVSAAAIVFSLDEAKSAFGFVYVNIYHLLDGM